MRFSLVMATVDRTQELRSFLASLEAQSYRDFELVVVDQNPDERLVPILAGYAEEFPVCHLRVDLHGISHARNVGLEQAGGDVIAFPDDDCLYPPDVLERVAGFFAEHPEADGLTGRSVDGEGHSTNGRFGAEPAALDRLTLWGRHISYTIFVRGQSVRGLRFDEGIGTGAGTMWGAGEETDYLLRILERGGALHYDPGLTVVHHDSVPPYDAKSASKAYLYGCGAGRLLKKYDLPLWFRGKWLVRPAGGAALALAALRLPEARHRWSTFRGRLRGMLSVGGEA